jgi:N12 class adenine-specific DNA methylase
VIGSKRKRISRGARKGLITSETDTPQERAQKWTMLQTGQVDVVVLSYDALARTKMNEEQVLAYVEQVEAVSRSIALRKRAPRGEGPERQAGEKLSERERALLEHGVRAWVEEILALPNDWEYDPGVAWDEIGIDMLVVDEAAAFKNLYKPQAREDGVPKFMGGGGEGSDRAWQLDFRAAAVRRQTGGAGVVLLTATPRRTARSSSTT